MSMYGGSWHFGTTTNYLTNQMGRNVRFIGGRIRRCREAAAVLNSVVDTTWVGVRFESSWRGIWFQFGDTSLPTSAPALAATGKKLTGHQFIGCAFDYNERDGVRIEDLESSSFINCRALNNSQCNLAGNSTGARHRLHHRRSANHHRNK
jgi:hypothetical protein